MFRTSFFALALSATLPAAETSPLSELTYSGDQAALAELDRDIQSAGKNADKLTALEKRLLADLGRRDTPFSARQVIAQRLALVLNAAPDAKSASHRTFAAMLVDERDSDVARLALQPVPGPAIDQLIVDALAKATGRTRLGLLDTIAVRRIATAVDVITPLLRNADKATTRAAARALGEIGTMPALAALKAAPIELTAGARLAATARLPAPDALNELRELQQNSAAPEPVRLAAFRTSLDVDPSTAAKRVAEVLRGKDAALKRVALEAVVSLPKGSDLPSLAELDAPTLAALVTALGRRAEPNASGPVASLLSHTDAEVRAAALTALGFLPGNREIALQLARIAASAESSDEAKLARQSLARLNGPDVSASILAGAQGTDAKARPVFIEQLALRNQTEGLPLLLKARTDSAAEVRLAAVAALGEIAPVSEQRALLDWALGATDEAEQSRALRSFVNVTLREPSAETRGKLLFETLAKTTPDVAKRLLPALSRIGGKQSAEAAAKLALHSDVALADAATSALTRWPDSTALSSLSLVAEQATVASARDAALAGALRHFERNRDAWTPATTDGIARLLKAAKEPAPRKTLVALLHRANDSAALSLAESLKSDAALASAAATAADVIRANQAGKPRITASGSTGSVRNMLDGKTSTRWNVPTEGDEWIEIDFLVSRPLQTITLDQTTRGAEFPERYEVYITDDPKKPGAVVASGKGQQNKTVIMLPANTRGRYAIIKNVAERKDSQWSIVELYVD